MLHFNAGTSIKLKLQLVANSNSVSHFPLNTSAVVLIFFFVLHSLILSIVSPLTVTGKSPFQITE